VRSSLARYTSMQPASRVDGGAEAPDTLPTVEVVEDRAQHVCLETLEQRQVLGCACTCGSRADRVRIACGS
jgi:hypothetical protein